MIRKFVITAPLWVLFVFLAVPILGLYLDRFLSFRLVDFGYSVVGLLFVAFAIYLFLWCFNIWARINKGNLAKPPDFLLVKGPYKYTRNPVMLSYMLYLFGFTIFLGSRSLLLLTVLFFLFIHYVVIPKEEKGLEKRFRAYKNYKKKVPRWVPKFS